MRLDGKWVLSKENTFTLAWGFWFNDKSRVSLICMVSKADELTFKLMVLDWQHVSNREKVVSLWENFSHLH